MSAKKENQRPPRSSAPSVTSPRLQRRMQKESNQSFASTRDSEESLDEMRFPVIPDYYRRSCERKLVKKAPAYPAEKSHSRKFMSVDLTRRTSEDEKQCLEAPGEEQTCPIDIRTIVPTMHPNLKSIRCEATVFEPSPSPKSLFSFLCCWTSQHTR